MSEANAPAVSVVVPAYRSASSATLLLSRLRSSLDAFVAGAWEIIVVEDASPDDGATWRAFVAAREDDPRVRLLRLAANRGQQRAVLCGIEHARGDVIVTMDDDLQQRPEDIELLVRGLQATDVDVVIGSYSAKRHGLLRRLGTWLVKWVSFAAVGAPRSLDLTSFRAIRRSVALAAAADRQPNPVVGYLLLRACQGRVVNVAVQHEPRAHGQSGYRAGDLVSYFNVMLFEYSRLGWWCVAAMAALVFAAVLAVATVLGAVVAAAVTGGWLGLAVLRRSSGLRAARTVLDCQSAERVGFGE